MRVKKKGVRNWLDDIITPTRTFDEQLQLLRETFDCLRQRELSVNLPSELCFSVVEWLGMVIDGFGIKPARSKTEAITQLSQPSTVEEVRVLLRMADYLRKYVPNNNSVLAPISDLLRDSRFRSKKARRVESQTLSAKYRRWALRLMQYDMELPWRPGTRHQFADTLSRSHGNKIRGATFDESFPGGNTKHRGPQGA